MSSLPSTQILTGPPSRQSCPFLPIIFGTPTLPHFVCVARFPQKLPLTLCQSLSRPGLALWHAAVPDRPGVSCAAAIAAKAAPLSILLCLRFLSPSCRPSFRMKGRRTRGTSETHRKRIEGNETTRTLGSESKDHRRNSQCILTMTNRTLSVLSAI